MPYFQSLTSDDWPLLRRTRLTALHESPQAFLATHSQEYNYGEKRWRDEFTRGDWTIGLIDSRPISLVGTTHEPCTPLDQRFVEYLWVSPTCRRQGIASSMLTAVLDRLRTDGVSIAYLWVLEGNGVAASLYKQLGFVSTDLRQPIPANPARTEEQLRLDLRSPTG